jgi:2-(1,2-epoxy-1,2-dihydrophenyl)acetyl-CoA isomerase
MSSDDILYSVADGAATITLNRPERLNAFTISMFDHLFSLLQQAEQDRSVRVIVLTGAGRGFCSGADVTDIAAVSGDLSFDQRVERLRRWTLIPQHIRNMSKIVVAAINGPAAGMGLALALACDLRLGATSAKCATSFLKVGFSGDFGGPYFLTRLIGSARARQLFLMGETLEAKEAYRLGLLNWLVPDADFGAERDRVLQLLLSSSPVALGYMKRNFNLAEELTFEQYLAVEANHQVRTALSDDAREAQGAAREKRHPVFPGR